MRRREGHARAGSADPARHAPSGTCSPSPSASPVPSTAPSLVELEPRIFSFNSPHGACARCTGLGSQMEIDPELVVPDPALSIAEGALAPWAGSTSNYYEQVTEAIAERYGVDLRGALGGSAGGAARRVPGGTGGEPVQVTYRNRYGRSAPTRRASRGSCEPRTPLPRDRLRVDTREDRGVHVAAAPARPAAGPPAPGVARGARRRHADRGLLRALGAPGARLAGRRSSSRRPTATSPG